MKKKTSKIILCILILSMLFTMGGCASSQNKDKSKIIDEKTFVDDMGNKFVIDKPYTKIVSLYSAHTENLYTIGAGDQLIGAHKTSIYPPEAAFLPRYDYKGDPEKLIAAQPDLVLSRPFVNRNYPEYIEALEKAGLNVVSLYPASNTCFEKYVTILGMLTGKEKEVKKELKILDERLNDVQKKVSVVEEKDKKTAFFEATQTQYRTVTTDSNPARAIEMAGGINIASDVKPIEKGSTIAEFGLENIMLNADNIDVYISQRGAMNGGGSILSIQQRDGFDAIKAVREDKILELNEKLISSPTFRYYKGVNEIARMLYPDIMDDISEYRTDEPLTREDYACLTVKMTHVPIFVPASSHYYETEYYNHTYGMYDDVLWDDRNFDLIETASTNSFIKGTKKKDGTEHFDKDGFITREDLAFTLYMMLDIEKSDKLQRVNDLSACENSTIVQKIVTAGLMNTDESGNFNPDQTVTGNEAIKLIEEGMKKFTYTNRS